MQMLRDNRTTKFKWENWINAAMGLMKGRGEHMKESTECEDFEGPLTSIRPANLTRELLIVPLSHEKLPNLAREVKVWTGWPIFDIRVCQFERSSF